MPYYDSIAKGYGELYKEEQANKVSIIKKNISINKDTKILDVGCGTGVSSDFECFVVGIDPSLELLMLNKNPMRVLGVAESLPFKNESFDYVISVTSIHNFDGIEKSISEIKRVGRHKFVFTILKKSAKLESIKEAIEKNFKVDKELDEEKDIILLCRKTAKHNIYI